MSYLADDKRVPGALARLNGYFNLTWTYRTDSDIVGQRFGSAARLKSDPLTGDRVPTMSTPTLRSLVLGKRKLIAWVVSKCSTPSRREAIVLRLQRYLSVDIYGGCADYFGVSRSPAACPPLLNSDGAVNDDACEAMLTDYKFYIAFENSVCRDYVTEKFFRIAQYVVPVVMRWRDYADLAPNGSYIAVDQFVSVQALAEHLLYLNRTPQAYMSYFKWHELMYMSSRREDLNVVDLCTRLLSKGLPERKIYSNLSDWWNTQGNCELDEFSDATEEPRCMRCRRPIKKDTPVKDAQGGRWHQRCFVCPGCRDSLVDATDIVLLPRVQPTQNDIAQQDYLIYHTPCYRCDRCSSRLKATDALRIGNKSYCDKCFKKQVNVVCFECEKPITSDVLDALDRTYHPECFKCKRCQQILGDEFMNVEERPYCEKCGNFAIPMDQMPKGQRKAHRKKVTRSKNRAKRHRTVAKHVERARSRNQPVGAQPASEKGTVTAEDSSRHAHKRSADRYTKSETTSPCKTNSTNEQKKQRSSSATKNNK